jgi:hypothetical protein
LTRRETKTRSKEGREEEEEEETRKHFSRD